MNQLHRIQKLAKKITYKPGWKFTVTEYGTPSAYTFSDCGVELLLHCPLIDVDSLKPTTINFLRRIPLYELDRLKDEDIIKYYLCRTIQDMELHEIDEWMKFDGVHIKDPHPERKGKNAA